MKIKIYLKEKKYLFQKIYSILNKINDNNTDFRIMIIGDQNDINYQHLKGSLFGIENFYPYIEIENKFSDCSPIVCSYKYVETTIFINILFFDYDINFQEINFNKINNLYIYFTNTEKYLNTQKYLIKNNINFINENELNKNIDENKNINENKNFEEIKNVNENSYKLNIKNDKSSIENENIKLNNNFQHNYNDKQNNINHNYEKNNYENNDYKIKYEDYKINLDKSKKQYNQENSEYKYNYNNNNNNNKTNEKNYYYKNLENSLATEKEKLEFEYKNKIKNNENEFQNKIKNDTKIQDEIKIQNEMQNNKSESKTIIIIKPCVVRKKLEFKLLSDLKNLNIDITFLFKTKVPINIWKKFYEDKKEYKFYDEMCKYLSSGEVCIIIAQGNNIIQRTREIIGPTDPKECKSHHIRYIYGENIEDNAIHSSDSEENYQKEKEILSLKNIIIIS